MTKVYATWAGYPVHDTSKWENAAKTAKILVESGKHHLLSDFEQLWKNTCNGVWDDEESLIEVSFYAPTVTGVSAKDLCGCDGSLLTERQPEYCLYLQHFVHGHHPSGICCV